MTDPGRRDRPGRRFLALLALVVLGALVIRFDLLQNRAPDVPAFGDAHAYHQLGRQLADGRGYVRPYELERQGRVIPTAEYPPGLPVVLAVVTKAGVDSEDGQRAVLVLVGGITVGLVGLLGRRLGGDRAGLLAAFAAALHPALWAGDLTLMAEPLAACLGVALLLVALAAHDRPTWARWAALGALTGLGALVRAELVLTGVLLVLGVAWSLHRPPRDRVLRVAVAGAAAVLVLAPWTIRNYARFHRVVPVSNNSGSVARGANCDLAYHGQFTGLWVTNVGDVGGDQVDPAGRCFSGFTIHRGFTEADSAAELRREGQHYLRAHLGEVPRVVVARLGRTVGLYRFDQSANFSAAEGRDGDLDRLGTRLFQVVALVALVGAVGPWRRGGARLVLLAPIAAVTITVAATYGSLRFRTVVDPIVVLLAVLATVDIARWVMDYRRPPCP